MNRVGMGALFLVSTIRYWHSPPDFQEIHPYVPCQASFQLPLLRVKLLPPFVDSQISPLF